MCLLCWDHSSASTNHPFCYKNIYPSFLQARLSNTSSPYQCAYDFWFAYLLILVRVLPPFPKGVRGDWIKRDRCWWTNAFLSLGAVQLSLRDSFCFPLELLTLSENGYPWVLAWTLHTERENWPSSTKGRDQLLLHQRGQWARACLNKLWVSGTEEGGAWRGAESRELGVKLQEGKEIQEFTEKQGGQQQQQQIKLR